MASLKEKMKAIRQSGLRTADLIEPGPELDERYKEALARLAEEERLKTEAEARPRDGDAPPAKRPMTARPPERELSFVLERVGDRLTATWREGAWLSRPGMERHWHARRTATLRTKADSRGVRASIPVWKSNLQPDFNVLVCDRFDASSSDVLRELDESNRFVQKSAESTSI